jgi:hypothetical protein
VLRRNASSDVAWRFGPFSFFGHVSALQLHQWLGSPLVKSRGTIMRIILAVAVVAACAFLGGCFQSGSVLDREDFSNTDSSESGGVR